jgi:hypothetical protein
MWLRNLPNRGTYRIKSFNDPFNDIFELDIVPDQHLSAFGKIRFEFKQFCGGLAIVFDIAN